MPTHNPFPIFSVDPASVSWRNKLVGQRRIVSCNLGEHSVQFEFLPSMTVEPTEFVEVRLGGSAFWIGVEDIDRLPLVGELGVSGIRGLPKEILLGVLEIGLEGWTKAIALECDAPCTIHDFFSGEAIDKKLARVGFRLTFESNGLLGCVIAGESAMQWLSEFITRYPVGQSIDCDTLPITCHLEVGETFVRIDDLHSLNRHDVLLVTNPASSGSDHAIAKFPSPLPSWRVKFDEQTIHFEEPVVTSESPPPENAILVTIRRGTFSRSVAEIRELSVGQTFSIMAGRGATLWIGQTAFASGELISTAGRVGVRIESFLDSLDGCFYVNSESAGSEPNASRRMADAVAIPK